MLLALAPALWRLTHAAEKARPSAVVSPTAVRNTIRLHLTFAPRPSSFRVLHLGKAVWSATVGNNEMEQTLEVPFPEQGIDLEFQIAWPEDVVGALRVRLTDPKHREHDKSVWGRGATTEVLTFP